MSRHFKWVIGIVTVLIINSCSRTTENSPTQGVTKVLVEQSLKPLMESEIAIFQQLYPQARIEPVYMYDAQLMAYFMADSTDLAITTHPLSDEEVAHIQQERIWPQQLTFAKDGLALIVRKDFPFDSITSDQLKGMLLGEPAALPFHLVFDHKGSATVKFLEDSFLDGKSIADNCYAVNSERTLIDYVQDNLSSIGIIGVNNIIDRNDTSRVSFLKAMKILKLSNETGKYFPPVQSYLYTGEYPLTRTISIFNREARSGLATGFAAFLASERGQRIVLREGLVPTTMPVRLVEISNRSLN
ncbi:MAG: substrate-binding domain-containing protein [Imperialibacter sp.]|uniref:PstS family phosphate ABC transporter substrate-binding protein n=1 Tax=Imperialibacter sp. TaxID=2038411 RepID=UPI0032EFE202